jgi:ribA/ribD-fused uncharacterized protein
MKINTDNFQFEKVHRIGRLNTSNNVNKPRSIIVTFNSYIDRMIVWKNRKLFNGIFINEDFPDEIFERRRKLKPILSKALSLKMEAFLTVDKLIVEKKTYTVKNLDQLPAALNTRKLSTVQVSDDIIGFYGGHSPLSNFYEARFTENNQSFDHVEQYYGHKKALAAGDEVTAHKILLTKSPLQCLKLHKNVKLDLQNWKEQETVMKRGCFLKFTQNPRLQDFLISTGKSTLVEANNSDFYWGAGLALDNTDLKVKAKWKGKNKLGETLEFIRNTIMKDLNDK